MALPVLHIRGAWRRGSMFSHTLGRRTLKYCLMLAGVHADAVGFFLRRASESMHNNFAIYCGLMMVHWRCYIGLECTILFWERPLSGHSSHKPTGDFYNKTEFEAADESWKLWHFWDGWVNISAAQHPVWQPKNGKPTFSVTAAFP